MTNQELINFTRKYQSKWVAKDSKTNRVLKADKDLSILAEKLEKTKPDYTLEKIPPLNTLFIP